MLMLTPYEKYNQPIKFFINCIVNKYAESSYENATTAYEEYNHKFRGTMKILIIYRKWSGEFQI